MLFKHIGPITALLLGFHTANAADIQIVPASSSDGRSGRPEVYWSGAITAEAVERLKLLANGGDLEGAIIYLDSAGGDPQEGMNLGGFIREHQMNTAVGRKGQRPGVGRCMSACVLAYAGGTFRFIDQGAQLAIHRFYRKTPTSADLDIAQVMSAAITSYFIRMGIDPDLFSRMVRVPAGGLDLLPHAEATKLRLINNGVLPARWAIEGKHGSVYLVGEQVTSNGTGKLIMTCAPNKQLNFSALYDAADNTAFIANNATAYSLRINERFIPVAHDSFRAKVSGDFVVASFYPPLNLIWEITGAEQVGFGFHTGDSDTFYGFLVLAAGHQDLIRSWVKHCTD